MPPSSGSTIATDVRRILLVDDHRVFTDLMSYALSTHPALNCVGTASSAAEGVAMAVELQPDVIVMDIEMPRQDGLTATRRIREVAPDAVIVIVTAHGDPQWVTKAAQSGASGFAPKDGCFEEILDIVLRVQQGSMLIAPSTFQARTPPARHGATAQPRTSLTQREHDVLAGLGRGHSATAIAATLGISVETCRGYIKSLHAKLGVRSQLEAVVKGQQLGLIEPANG